MNDQKRTAAYVVVAALAVFVAAEPWHRRSAPPVSLEQTGKLFPDFTDPRAASNMQIIKYDEATGTLHPFQVARVNGVWSIPSHHNYPADAKEHLAQAATALMDLEILGVAGTTPGEHELFGVLDPDPSKVAPGSVGIGTRVTMKDSADNVLADLIIGKEVKDKPTLRYVRKAGRDQVYTVAVATDKLSTKFGDWIEKDLLKLNPLDIRSIQLNDYSFGTELTLEGMRYANDQRGAMLLEYDETKNTWKLAKAVEIVDKKPVSGELKEGEELNNDKLAALKTALDDLQIVDVEAKPPGMKQLAINADVPEDKLQAQLRSLRERGFYAVQDRDGGVSLLSSEGEVVVSMKDGLQYVLRFGDVASTDDEKDAGKEAGKDAAKKGAGSRLNRYLFVMAQFDPALIPMPTLEKLPEDEAAAGDEKKDADDKDSTDKANADEKSASDEKKPEAKPDADTKSQQAKEEDEAERKKKLEDQRAAIERENKRKEDEYKEKLKKGEEHVSELNDRFAGWYYIISDDVYHKIHLSRADVVKKKEDKDAKPGQTDTPAGLEQLEKQGLGK